MCSLARSTRLIQVEQVAHRNAWSVNSQKTQRLPSALSSSSQTRGRNLPPPKICDFVAVLKSGSVVMLLIEQSHASDRRCRCITLFYIDLNKVLFLESWHTQTLHLACYHLLLTQLLPYNSISRSKATPPSQHQVKSVSKAENKACPQTSLRRVLVGSRHHNTAAPSVSGNSSLCNQCN